MELRKRHALHDSDEIAILQEVSGTGTNKNQAEGEPGAIAEEPHHGRRVSEDRGVGDRGLPAAAPLHLANFTRLALGCIEAKFCKKICV